MRADMFKVIVERARINQGPGLTFRTPDIEDLPHRESLRKRHRLGWDSGKTLNENLSPLKRYIEKQVNRPWNKVWSEICANLNVDSTVQQHVRDHVQDFVSVDCEIVEPHERCSTGVMTAYKRRGGKHTDRRNAVSEGKLYVHPDTGIILKARRKLKGSAPKAPQKPFVRHPDGKFSAKINGIWYAVRLVPLEIVSTRIRRPDYFREGRFVEHIEYSWKGVGRYVNDAVLGSVRIDDRWKLKSFYGDMVRGTDAKQLSKKDLVRRGLRND